MNKYYYIALSVVIIIVCVVVAYIATEDKLEGLWRAPDEFVRKIGLSDTSLGVGFSKNTMYLMIYSHGHMTLQRYKFERHASDDPKSSIEATITFDRTTTESPNLIKIDPLFIDGRVKINIDGKSLLMYDNTRALLHAIRV